MLTSNPTPPGGLPSRLLLGKDPRDSQVPCPRPVHSLGRGTGRTAYRRHHRSSPQRGRKLSGHLITRSPAAVLQGPQAGLVHGLYIPTSPGMRAGRSCLQAAGRGAGRVAWHEDGKRRRSRPGGGDGRWKHLFPETVGGGREGLAHRKWRTSGPGKAGRSPSYILIDFSLNGQLGFEHILCPPRHHHVRAGHPGVRPCEPASDAADD